MNWKKYLIVGILILIVIGAILIYTFSNKNASKSNQISEKSGKYFNENRTLLGTCTKKYTPSQDGYGGTYSYRFYDLKENLLGSCSEYSGPGASGWKGGCDEDSVKNSIGTKIEEGMYAGRIAQKYECETE